MSALRPAALSAATCQGRHLTLAGQLDRGFYVKVDKAIKAVGGRWDRRAGAHVFDGDAAQSVAAMLESGMRPALNPHAYFPTPRDVCYQLIDMVDLRSLEGTAPRVLEPSAGEGALADVVRACCCDAIVNCVEIDGSRCRELERRGHHVVNADFLTLDATDERLYDVIVMNPPFAVDGNPIAWFDHVMLAWEFLAPTGVLAAITPTNWMVSESRRELMAFRQFVRAYGTADRLPEDAFRESGTGVQTALVRICGPGSSLA